MRFPIGAMVFFIDEEGIKQRGFVKAKSYDDYVTIEKLNGWLVDIFEAHVYIDITMLKTVMELAEL